VWISQSAALKPTRNSQENNLTHKRKRTSRIKIRELSHIKENQTMNYSITKKLITGITATAILLAAGIPAAVA
jgi:hypothetical protein